MASEMRDLNAALWAAADEMRKVMSADEYIEDYKKGQSQGGRRFRRPVVGTEIESRRFPRSRCVRRD